MLSHHGKAKPFYILLIFSFVISILLISNLEYVFSGSESMNSRSRLVPPEYLELADRQKINPATPVQAFENNTAQKLLPNSVLVFQSIHDNKWQIFRSNDDGSQLVRLPNGSQFNRRTPQLRVGASHVVFIRDKFKDTIHSRSEVRIMDINGESDRSLFLWDGHWAYPSWGPNKERFVASYYDRDGSNRDSDLIVVDSSGNYFSERQLTSHDDYDSMPSWDPNNDVIAWVSRRTGGYRIWKTDEYGENKEMLSTLPYSLRPSWSPDGSKIAFDADSNGDGWQEIWVMDADGSNQRLLYNPGPNRDAWVSGWSPDGRYITFTNISFLLYQGNWYWTEAYAEALNIHNLQRVRLSNRGVDWNPSWQLVDRTKPRTRINQLPPASFGGGFYLRWETETDLSPADYYDIQFRQDEDPTWVDLESTDIPMIYFEGDVGSTYQFRVRAVDQAGNVENWDDTNTTITTIYDHYFRGGIVDNRGAIVDEANLQLMPTPVYTKQTQSRYEAWLNYDEHVFSFETSLYGPLPETTLPFAPLTEVNLVAPPVDNLLKNSHFEDENDANWGLIGDELPAYNEGAAHTGDWSMVFGNNAEIVDYSECVRPLGDPGLPSCPYNSIQDAVDNAASGKTIWVFPGSFQETIVMTESHKIRSVGGAEHTIIDGNWEDTVFRLGLHYATSTTLIEGFTIYKGNSDRRGAAVAVSGDSNVVVLRGNYFLQNASQDDSAVSVIGSSDVLIDRNWFVNNYSWGVSRLSRPACIMVDQSDVKIENNIFLNNRGDNDGPCIKINSTVSQKATIRNNTFINNSNNIFVAQPHTIQNNILTQSKQFGVSNCKPIEYNNVWGNFQNYPSSSCHDQIGGNGNISVDPEFVDPLINDFRLQLNSPVRDMGNPVPEFNDLDGSRNDLGAYGGPNAMPEPIGEREPTTSWNHYWIDMDDWRGEDITVTLGIRDDVSGFRSAISQTVSLPNELSNATLSFMYESGATEIIGSESFVVQIQSNLGELDEFVILSNEANQIWVNLDDVTLGSTYPDIWVDGLSLAADSAPGTIIQRTIYYGNQGAVSAEQGTLTVTLPSEFTFVSANIPPAQIAPSLVWDLNNLASNSQEKIELTLLVADTVSVGDTVTTNLQVSTISEEYAVLNNIKNIETEIGYTSLLPTVIKD